jgi:hypothetical protein
VDSIEEGGLVSKPDRGTAAVIVAPPRSSPFLKIFKKGLPLPPKRGIEEMENGQTRYSRFAQFGG